MIEKQLKSVIGKKHIFFDTKSVIRIYNYITVYSILQGKYDRDLTNKTQ